MNAIEFTNVSKQYGQFQALKDITLSVKKGEKLVICGPSGSGKSTLIRTVNGLEGISHGDIKVFGQPISKTSPRKVGMVFQHFHLFPHLSILDNLILAPTRTLKLSRRDAIATALHFLNQVGIADQADKYPIQLSGGQQQRVAIARSLCMKPELLLFDEPTSALDPETIQEVLEVMTGIAKSGMTMVCVTHEMGFARKIADRVLFMDQGRALEIAPPEQLFNNPKHPRTQHFLEQILSHQ
ncbi:amino acid ABC transporter ATP-binding protein [Vibrio pectenicida]|uniref:amino acid ABC transporter ATP-binding protein n=1 Tax=Vibrio pectenicida TaxID=62763 RepID=UPI003B9AA22D